MMVYGSDSEDLRGGSSAAQPQTIVAESLSLVEMGRELRGSD